MKKINLCRVIYGFAPGGGGSVTHTIELSRHMASRLNKQFIIVPKQDMDTSELDQSYPFEVCRIDHCKFSWLIRIKKRFIPWLPVIPLIHFSYGISVIKKIISLNKSYKIDIIHSHGVDVGPSATISGWILKIPVVWMLHGTCLAYSKICGFYETIMTRLFKPDHLLVLDDGSPAPQKFTKLLKDNVTVVYHGIDTNKFKPLKKPGYLLNELSLPENTFIVLSPHSLVPVKGQEYAIEAFDQFMLNYQVENAFLIIAGSGELRNTLEQTVKETIIAKFVKFVGAIPNDKMPDYFALSDVVLSTSFFCNMNRTTQEAMACGKPVIAFDSGGAKKVVINGQTGLLVEPGNNHALANQIAKLNNDCNLRCEMGKQGREFIIQNRGWEKRIEQELTIYRMLTQWEQNIN
jgi:glycosyltransferase involved in cell wall biosynthesis